MANTKTRRTRIVCVSDTHNTTVKLPQGDVLIHAGDLTNQGTYSELSRAVAWLEKADFECKVVIAGNHDTTLDKTFNAHYGAGSFHSSRPQSSEECLALLAGSPTITYLCHDSTTIYLKRPGGPHTRAKVFGSPCTPHNGEVRWAFTYERAGAKSASPSNPAARNDTIPAEEIWSLIPVDADIVVTHTPPLSHCDWSEAYGRPIGCEELRRVLGRVRPRLAVCGHVHSGRGAETVIWGDESSQLAVEKWEESESARRSRKMALIDLTSRGIKEVLEDGTSVANGAATAECQTCIVNCAITANSYPHKGGRRFNKPIVVDMDLPVWEEAEQPPS